MKITPQQRALGIALLSGLLGLHFVVRYLQHLPLGAPGSDIDQLWWMAREIVRGQNPYVTDRALRLFPTAIYYPLTAGIVALPIALLGLVPMRFVFVTGSAVLFGYAIGRSRPYLWPTLIGMPFLVSLGSAQWTPLLATAILWPALGWVAVAKPNLGLAMLAGAPTRRDALTLVGGGLGIVLVSLAISPGWPNDWLTALRGSVHFHPLIFRPGGFLVLLAALRWRDPDARLVLALGLVPVTGLMYDMLPACLACRTRAQAAVLALISYIPWATITSASNLADQMWENGETTLWFGLLPAAGIVLLRWLPEVRFLGWLRDSSIKE